MSIKMLDLTLWNVYKSTVKQFRVRMWKKALYKAFSQSGRSGREWLCWTLNPDEVTVRDSKGVAELRPRQAWDRQRVVS